MAAPILDAITIEGFKSIASIRDLPMRRMNVLIGANGSGKSNFIGVFKLLRELKEGRLQHYVGKAGGAERLLHVGSKTTSEIHIQLHLEARGAALDVRLTPTAGDNMIANVGLRMAQTPEPTEWGGTWLPPSMDRLMATWRSYHFHDTTDSSPMRKTSRLHDDEFLRGDGTNLPAFLRRLGRHHANANARIRNAIRQVAPFFDDFDLRPTRDDPDAIRLQWRHCQSDSLFEADALSDGTLRFIALATLLLQPIELRPDIILIDEPELGLHPAAINLLAALARSASVHTQVILATQSSLLLDHFEPEDVLVAERVRGATVFHRPDSARLASWLEDYTLGQLWEKNEIGGRPAKEVP